MGPTSGNLASALSHGQDAVIKMTRIDESNRPSLHLLDERDIDKHKLCLDLLQAAEEGDSREAKSLFDHYTQSMLLGEAITQKHETVLHVAAGAKQTSFVEDMIYYMKEKHFIQDAINSTLKLKTEKGNTPFCYAAMAGCIPTAKSMLREDRSLLKIRGAEEMMPLYLAALFGHKDMALYLYKKMKKYREELTLVDKRVVFFISIDTCLYDLALELLKDDDNNELAMAYYMPDGDESKAETPLQRLARTPLHLLDQTGNTEETVLSIQALQLIEHLWKKILEKEGAEVWKYFDAHKDLLFDAAHLGNFKFLAELIRLYPDLVHQKDENNRTIFHIAIMHRHDNLFNLIHKIGFNKQLIANYNFDEDGNTLLHLAATYPKPSPVSMVPGAALEMQRELRIFKEVERLVMPSRRKLKNKDDKTARELFTITHADLLKKGERWMRDTASQCMLVGTLIATVVFAAAFSVPGGYDDKEGIPNLWRSILFRIFAIADAIALSSSSISILMFLSILTSRYAEEDFYRSLPLKLVGGLLALSISISTMMLAFMSCFFLAYNHHRSNAIPILGTIFVFLPVIVFCLSQYSLVKDILYSSFWFRICPSQ